MNFYLAAILQALCLAPMGLGIYITMKIFNFPDITTDGSYTLGAVVCALCLSRGMSPWLAVPFTLLSGALAGILTALIHTKLRVNALLSGILVMTALYSINLTLLGRSNIPLLGYSTIFNIGLFSNGDFNVALVSVLTVLLFLFFIYYLLRTDFGLAMRATGNNELMIRSLGVNTSTIKIIGLAITNGLVALSGAMTAQFQGFTDISMGIGIVINGLGSVMIAETLIRLSKMEHTGIHLLFVVLGILVFQLVLAFTLNIGVDATLLKLLTSCFVLLIVALPQQKLIKSFKRY